MKGAMACVVLTCLLDSAAIRAVASDAVVSAADFARLPVNTWVLIDRENAAGGKAFARLIYARNADRLSLWGTGGQMSARNVFQRYELESFDPKKPGWTAAFPAAAAGTWTTERYPPFRILGQSGPDGLKHDEGPRLQCVGGYHATNRVRFWDFDGIARPSPIHTFNMACWDAKRERIVYYSDGCTFALDPRTNAWTDLKAKNHPKTCRTVAWANMAYDPEADQIILFGGGLATNPRGGAPTWLYDCAENVWHRPNLGQNAQSGSSLPASFEPPLRCNGALIYEPASRTMVLFAGYDQSAALNDTWLFDCRKQRWEARQPKRAPPPMYQPAAAPLPGGKVLVCGYDAREVKLHHISATSARRETWVYDVSRNEWTPIDGSLRLEGYHWLSASDCGSPGVVLLVAFGPERRTYALRYDPAAAHAELTGAPPGTVAWKYPEQKVSLEQAPPGDLRAQTELLDALPVNTFVDARAPGLLISKTWSTAVMDTDRSEVFYVGGGHSGYSGNDIARYSLASNRWTLDMPPRFPPFLEGTNAGIFAWSYGMMPFSQHTYLWYCYDPVSKTVVYLARPSLQDGVEVQLRDDEADTFIYEAKKHGHATWVYDPAAKRMHPPSFGRPFTNPWHLSVVGTPHGVFAACDNQLYRGTVDRDSGQAHWTLFDRDFPKPRQEIKYHYEFQPLRHDTKRNRLIQLKGDAQRVDVYARPLDGDGTWQQLETTGKAAIGREAVYLAKHDTLLWLNDQKLFAFDCATHQMARLDIVLPKGLYSHECAFVYDPKHDVCIGLIPSRFTGPLQTFLFRYDPRTARRL